MNTTTNNAKKKKRHPRQVTPFQKFTPTTTFPGKERNSMIAQPETAVKPAPTFRPEGNGLGTNPARFSGRMVRATWDAHQRLVASLPTEAIAEYQNELHQERRTGYARFIAGQAARSCANSNQWGGWLQAQGEYQKGRFASYSTTPQPQEIMTQAERQGYQAGLAHQRRLEAA